MRRANLLVAASSVAMLGWGLILPYQYAYVAHTRGWGAGVAVAVATAFSLGALVAAPLAGRLADRVPPVRVVLVARLLSALSAAALVFAGTPATFLAATAGLGFFVSATGPAQSVLVLSWVRATDRRRVFAWQFSGQSLGMGVGALASGYVVDLTRPTGMAPAFWAAAAGFVVGAWLTAAARRGAPSVAPAVSTRQPRVPAEPGTSALAALRTIWGHQPLRLALLLTVALALAFYVQFETGLPAYALTVLDAPGRTVGTAAAVNCFVILALQMLVVRWTARRSAPVLLGAVAALWLACWVVLGLASGLPAIAGGLFVSVYGVFAVGETMYAPVLNPLAASLAPAPLVGTVLGVVAAAQTGATALGPVLSGVLLATGAPLAFIGVHVAICALAVIAAWRLHQAANGAAVAAGAAASARVVELVG